MLYRWTLRTGLWQIVLFGMAVLVMVTDAAHANARQPNIVFIFVDDLGVGEIGGGAFDGGIPTPAIDAIARRGVTFTDGYVTASLCAPSRAGALTGRYNQKYGIYRNPAQRAAADIGLPAAAVTMAERLRGAGYATGMIGKWHLGSGSMHPMQQGIAEFLDMLDSDHPYYGEDPANPILRGYTPEPQPGYLTDAFAREAASFIRRHAAEPFFLYFAPNAVHSQYQATAAELATVPGSVTGDQRRIFAAVLLGLDRAIGAIDATLRAEKLDQDTIIAIVSDNGGVRAGRTTPLQGRKGSNYEGGIRVPFILAWPRRLAAGSTYRAPISSLDLTPTFLAAAGASAAADLDGVDLLSYLAGRVGDPHAYLFWGDRRKGAVRRGNWKWLTTGELFDLRADIGERNNLIAARPDIVADLRRARNQWLTTLAPPQS